MSWDINWLANLLVQYRLPATSSMLNQSVWCAGHETMIKQLGMGAHKRKLVVSRLHMALARFLLLSFQLCAAGKFVVSLRALS